MNPVISKVKKQYFSKQNIDFLVNIIQTNYNIIELDFKDKLFKIQNEIYNNFFETIHNKKIDEQHLENILIELNKLSIQFYITNNQTPNQTHNNNNNNKQTPDQTPFISDNDYQTTEIKEIHDTSYCAENKSQNLEKIQQTLVIQELKDIIVEIANDINYIKKSQDKVSPIEHVKQYLYLDLHSSSSTYKQNEYEFILEHPLQNFKVKDFKIYFNDSFNNINEYNNKIELVENTTKTKVIISPGNYSIQELVTIIEHNINHKSVFKSYKIIYDKNKNRITISCDKNFNIIFIENDHNNVQLKDILGYSRNEYCSNTSYSSENKPNIDIYTEIYIKVKDEINTRDQLNKFHTNIKMQDYDEYFKYFHKNNYNNNNDEFQLEIPTYKIVLQLYYKSNNKILKFVKKIDFNIILDLQF